MKAISSLAGSTSAAESQEAFTTDLTESSRGVSLNYDIEVIVGSFLPAGSLLSLMCTCRALYHGCLPMLLGTPLPSAAAHAQSYYQCLLVDFPSRLKYVQVIDIRAFYFRTLWSPKSQPDPNFDVWDAVTKVIEHAPHIISIKSWDKGLAPFRRPLESIRFLRAIPHQNYLQRLTICGKRSELDEVLRELHSPLRKLAISCIDQPEKPTWNILRSMDRFAATLEKLTLNRLAISRATGAFPKLRSLTLLQSTIAVACVYENCPSLEDLDISVPRFVVGNAKTSDVELPPLHHVRLASAKFIPLLAFTRALKLTRLEVTMNGYESEQLIHRAFSQVSTEELILEFVKGGVMGDNEIDADLFVNVMKALCGVGLSSKAFTIKFNLANRSDQASNTASDAWTAINAALDAAEDMQAVRLCIEIQFSRMWTTPESSEDGSDSDPSEGSEVEPDRTIEEIESTLADHIFNSRPWLRQFSLKAYDLDSNLVFNDDCDSRDQYWEVNENEDGERWLQKLPSAKSWKKIW